MTGHVKQISGKQHSKQHEQLMQRLEHSYGVQETARKQLSIKHTAPAAAKSLQSCLTLCDPIDSSPEGSPVPGIPGRNTGVGCHFLHQCMKVGSEREVEQLCPTLSDPMDCSLPGSSCHGIFQGRGLVWGAIAFSTNMIKRQNDEKPSGTWWRLRSQGFIGFWNFGWHFEWGEKALKGFDREVV